MKTLVSAIAFIAVSTTIASAKTEYQLLANLTDSTGYISNVVDHTFNNFDGYDGSATLSAIDALEDEIDGLKDAWVEQSVDLVKGDDGMYSLEVTNLRHGTTLESVLNQVDIVANTFGEELNEAVNTSVGNIGDTLADINTEAFTTGADIYGLIEDSGVQASVNKLNGGIEESSYLAEEIDFTSEAAEALEELRYGDLEYVQVLEVVEEVENDFAVMDSYVDNGPVLLAQDNAYAEAEVQYSN